MLLNFRAQIFRNVLSIGRENINFRGYHNYSRKDYQPVYSHYFKLPIADRESASGMV